MANDLTDDAITQYYQDRNRACWAAPRHPTAAETAPSQCCCYECNKDRTVHGFPYASTHMILCPTCGNKRCPHATDHRHACTGSNEPGQAGSRY